MRIPKASEFFICGIEGLTLTEFEASFFKHNPLGGIILFKRNIESLEQTIRLNKMLIEINNSYPPLISVDQEGGRVARLRGICTDLPPMAQMSARLTESPHLAYRLGALQGRELASLGFNLNFSPVCDVMSNQENEVIGDRSFSSCPSTVAQLASQYIKGLQGAGVAACAKHFPGHGATSVDSHFALPRLSIDMREVETRELVPFREAIAADVATIMTAHVVIESLDSVPATLSKKALDDLLRTNLGYNNVIISDDLDMKALADHFSLPEIIEEGINASIDLFIVGDDFKKAVEAIGLLQHLIDTNEHVRNRAIKTAARLDRLRSRYIGTPKAPELTNALSIVRSSPHLELVAACS